MALSIILSPETERELGRLATSDGRSPADVAREIVEDEVVRRRLIALKDHATPQKLADLKPRRPVPTGSTPLLELSGKWPGTETDDEVELALSELS